jgi:hypothetical protein
VALMFVSHASSDGFMDHITAFHHLDRRSACPEC